jgi:hypothetical protein
MNIMKGDLRMVIKTAPVIIIGETQDAKDS